MAQSHRYQPTEAANRIRIGNESRRNGTNAGKSGSLEGRSSLHRRFSAIWRHSGWQKRTKRRIYTALLLYCAKVSEAERGMAQGGAMVRGVRAPRAERPRCRCPSTLRPRRRRPSAPQPKRAAPTATAACGVTRTPRLKRPPFARLACRRRFAEVDVTPPKHARARVSFATRENVRHSCVWELAPRLVPRGCQHVEGVRHACAWEPARGNDEGRTAGKQQAEGERT